MQRYLVWYWAKTLHHLVAGARGKLVQDDFLPHISQAGARENRKGRSFFENSSTMQPAPNLPAINKGLTVPKVMVTEAQAHRMVDEALYKAREEQAEMLNERAAEAQLLKFKNKKFRRIIVDLRQQQDHMELESDKNLDRIERLKVALRSRTMEFDDLQMRYNDLQTACDGLKLKLAKAVRPMSGRSRVSRRSLSPVNSRPVSAVSRNTDKSTVRPKSAGSILSSSGRSSSIASTSRASSASSTRPQSAGAKPLSRPGSGERRVAFLDEVDEEKNNDASEEVSDRPAPGSILSPIKEVREVTSDEEDNYEKSDGSKKSQDDSNGGSSQSDEGHSDREVENKRVESGTESAPPEPEPTKDGLTEERLKEMEQYNKFGARPGTPDLVQNELRPYTASPRLESEELKKEVEYLLEDDEQRPFTAPEPGNTPGSGPTKKRRIAFPKRKPKHVAKVKETKKEKRKRMDEDISVLERIQIKPEPDERDELENLYKTFMGNKWLFFLSIQGVGLEDNMMRRHACSGATYVSILIFGLVRYFLTSVTAGSVVAMCELFMLCLAGYCQVGFGKLIFHNNLLKRLILFNLQNREFEYFAKQRWNKCVYIFQICALLISLLYSVLWISQSTTVLNPSLVGLGLLTVLFNVYMMQIVWHTLGVYIFMQVSMQNYVLHFEHLERRNMENHVETFYKVRCMVDDTSLALGEYIYNPCLLVTATCTLMGSLDLISVDGFEQNKLIPFCLVLMNGGILFIIVFFGGRLSDACFKICRNLSRAFITFTQDRAEALKMEARMGGAGALMGEESNGPVVPGGVDKHNQFPLMLYELSLKYQTANSSFLYSYTSSHFEMGFRGLGVTLRQWHGVLVGIVLVSVLVFGIG